MENNVRKILVVVDMQNDFVTGVLGSEQARSIVPNVVNKVNEYMKNGDEVFFTRDTHYADLYFETQEGKNLHVPHCIINTDGWQIIPELQEFATWKNVRIFDKFVFGSVPLAKALESIEDRCTPRNTKVIVEFVGVCTGICVVSNVMLTKAFCLDTEVVVDASCCACLNNETHKAALITMKTCQVKVIND